MMLSSLHTTMSSVKTDIVVFGATGFTGRLITRYLSTHPQFTQHLFSFAIAARSQSKLHTLVQELDLPPNINTLQLDVTDHKSVEAAVKSARVVINTVGPYWTWGTPVVKACANNGIHYVDLTGEDMWIREIINKFDYLATKTGAVIINSCGYDSVPSDASAFLSNKTLKAHGPYDVGTSMTAHRVRGGISGGTLSTMMTAIEDVPKEKMQESIDYSLSPVTGPALPRFQFLYTQSIPGESTVPGGFFFMQPTNRKLVQRTFGLLEMEVKNAEAPDTPVEAIRNARRERYGPAFAYDEFLVMPSRLSAVIFSAVFAIGFGMLAYITPIRWIVKKYMRQPGSGPSEERATDWIDRDMAKGFFSATNHTISTSTPPVHVKSVFKGDRDPGYALTAIMISESALSLLLPPVSSTASQPSPSSSAKSLTLPEGLPVLARKGGVLTPMSALGDVLLTRLVDTGRFSIESHVVGEGASEETRKNQTHRSSIFSMAPSSDKASFRATLASAENIIILSGAGLSAASGIPTYRNADNSLWNNFDPLAYAVPEAFKDDPIGVWKFYHRRRAEYLLAKPNNAHRALAVLAHPPALARIAPHHKAPRVLHVTQNVDALALGVLESLPDQGQGGPSEAEGDVPPPAKDSLIEMHGDIFVTRCTACQHVQRSYTPALASALAELEKNSASDDGAADAAGGPAITLAQLPKCGGDAWAGSNRYGRCGGLLRPEVVWFGEVPPLMGEIARRMSKCDLLLVVGTSSTVQPAAGFAAQVKKNGGTVAVFNLGRSTGDEEADYMFLGPCDETLPDLLEVEKEMAQLWPQSQPV
ncbi:hypothetical protein D9615_009173 [Tricholomella constricta]|uniref:Deacetylase sirtuin-type domain-containing protein n=1 Tax=Tricholomella constricta TaxID=117010 RepID=A0A8H5LZS4_9AGAR|nr:hypothetical protein D9615_009173 [Tricholomella constricta]